MAELMVTVEVKARQLDNLSETDVRVLHKALKYVDLKHFDKEERDALDEMYTSITDYMTTTEAA